MKTPKPRWWLMRADYDGSCYRIFAGTRPRKQKGDAWEGTETSESKLSLCPGQLEVEYPHLKLKLGKCREITKPVIRFVKK